MGVLKDGIVLIGVGNRDMEHSLFWRNLMISFWGTQPIASGHLPFLSTFLRCRKVIAQQRASWTLPSLMRDLEKPTRKHPNSVEPSGSKSINEPTQIADDCSFCSVFLFQISIGINILYFFFFGALFGPTLFEVFLSECASRQRTSCPQEVGGTINALAIHGRYTNNHDFDESAVGRLLVGD